MKKGYVIVAVVMIGFAIVAANFDRIGVYVGIGMAAYCLLIARWAHRQDLSAARRRKAAGLPAVEPDKWF